MMGFNKTRAVTALIEAALGQPHPTPALKKALRRFAPEPKLPERLPTWWPKGRPLPKDLAKQMKAAGLPSFVKADGLDFSYPQRNALAFTTTWRGP